MVSSSRTVDRIFLSIIRPSRVTASRPWPKARGSVLKLKKRRKAPRPKTSRSFDFIGLAFSKRHPAQKTGCFFICPSPSLLSPFPFSASPTRSPIPLKQHADAHDQQKEGKGTPQPNRTGAAGYSGPPLRQENAREPCQDPPDQVDIP